MKTRNKSKAAKIMLMLENGDTTQQICEKLKTTPQYIYSVKSMRLAESRALQSEIFERPAPVNHVQVGGSHYKKHKIQVWDAIHDWRLGYFSGNIIKYVARHKEKNGIEDLKKALHYLQKYIQIIEAADGK